MIGGVVSAHETGEIHRRQFGARNIAMDPNHVVIAQPGKGFKSGRSEVFRCRNFLNDLTIGVCKHYLPTPRLTFAACFADIEQEKVVAIEPYATALRLNAGRETWQQEQ